LGKQFIASLDSVASISMTTWQAGRSTEQAQEALQLRTGCGSEAEQNEIEVQRHNSLLFESRCVDATGRAMAPFCFDNGAGVAPGMKALPPLADPRRIRLPPRPTTPPRQTYARKPSDQQYTVHAGACIAMI
jgi:hypothetical protein